MIYTKSNIEIRLTSSDSLAGSSEANILYVKPGGIAGAWPATISGNDIVYDTELADLDIAGKWQLQAEVYKNSKRLLTSMVVMEVQQGIQN
jgi:hypothetical protein